MERSKASLELQRKKLRDTTVRAPFAALIKDRQAVAGAYVRVNTALFTLVKIDPIRLRIEVPERMAPWVKAASAPTYRSKPLPTASLKAKSGASRPRLTRPSAPSLSKRSSTTTVTS